MWLSRYSLTLLTYGPLAYDLLTYDLFPTVLMVPRVSLVAVTQSTVTPSVTGPSIDPSVPYYLASSANPCVTVQGPRKEPISQSVMLAALVL